MCGFRGNRRVRGYGDQTGKGVGKCFWGGKVCVFAVVVIVYGHFRGKILKKIKTFLKSP